MHQITASRILWARYCTVLKFLMFHHMVTKNTNTCENVLVQVQILNFLERCYGNIENHVKNSLTSVTLSSWARLLTTKEI